MIHEEGNTPRHNGFSDAIPNGKERKRIISGCEMSRSVAKWFEARQNLCLALSLYQPSDTQARPSALCQILAQRYINYSTYFIVEIGI
jgi:hypothetical protein